MNFPRTLPTERETLELHRVTHQDAGIYMKTQLASRAHLSRFHFVQPAETQLALISRQQIIKAAFLKLINEDELHMGVWDRDAFVGGISLNPQETGVEAEVGYWLAERQTGKGYATVALRALARYARPLFPCVYADIREDNLPSIRVAERSDFVQAGQAANILRFELADGSGAPRA